MTALIAAGYAHALLFVLCVLGFASLALAMDRPQEDVFGRALSARASRRFRMAGWVLLGLALWTAISAYDTGLGLVLYSGHTSGAAGVVFIALLVWSRHREQQAARARAARSGSGKGPP